MKRIFLGVRGGDVFVDEAVVELPPKAADVQAVEFTTKPLEFAESHPETRSDLRIRGSASEFRREIAFDLFDLARLAAEAARAPVHPTQAVEDGATDAKARVGLELDIFARIEFVDGIDKAENSSVNEVIEGNLRRQAIVNPARSITDLRKIFDQQTLAFLGIDYRTVPPRIRSCRQHRPIPCPLFRVSGNALIEPLQRMGAISIPYFRKAGFAD
jgi:hypothetical protein